MGNLAWMRRALACAVIVAAVSVLFALPVSAYAVADATYDQIVHSAKESTGTSIYSTHGSVYGAPWAAHNGWRPKCASCHTGDLAKIHRDNCAVCHAGTNPPRKSFSVWNKTCQQGTCHPSSMLTVTLQAWVNRAGQIQDTSYGVGTSSQTTTTVLKLFKHKNSTPTSHVERLGRCVDCHYSGAKGTMCYDCHGTGATTKHTVVETTGTVIMGVHGYASSTRNVYGSYKCGTCHSGNLAEVHRDRCTVCHDGPNAPRTSFTKWNGTCQQGVCHPSSPLPLQIVNSQGQYEVIPNGTTGFAHKNLAETTHNAAGLVCANCHVPNIKYLEICVTCHANNANPLQDHTAREATGTSIYSTHGSVYGAPWAAHNGWKPKCASCHKGDLKTIHKQNCAICHSGANPPRKSFTVWNKQCQQGACHPSVTLTTTYQAWINTTTGKVQDTWSPGFSVGTTTTPLKLFKHKNSTPTSHVERFGRCVECHYPGAKGTMCYDCHGK